MAGQATKGNEKVRAKKKSENVFDGQDVVISFILFFYFISFFFLNFLFLKKKLGHIHRKDCVVRLPFLKLDYMNVDYLLPSDTDDLLFANTSHSEDTTVSKADQNDYPDFFDLQVTMKLLHGSDDIDNVFFSFSFFFLSFFFFSLFIFHYIIIILK